MIVPMKKVAIIVRSEDSKETASKLRSMGVLHIEHQQVPKGADIASLYEDIATLSKVIGILSSPEMKGSSGLKPAKILQDWRFVAKHVLDIRARIDHLEEYGIGLNARIAEWEPWGDFDPAAIEDLKKKDIFVKLYEIPSDRINEVPAGIIVQKIGDQRNKGLLRCALISRQEISLPFKEKALPAMGLAEMRSRLAEDKEMMRLLKDSLRKYTFYLERFIKIRDAFSKELEFHEAIHGMGSSGEIAYLVGYVPYDSVSFLKESACSNRWGIWVTDPSEDDAVPTLIRNPKWISIISPVFKLIEVVPGYKELDMSLWFLIFLSIFFGMLIGDAGYGSVFLAITLFANARLGKRVSDKSAFYLFYIFSCCAIIWGILTGALFGQEWLHGVVRPLLPALRDDRNVQSLCFFMGALHLSIAHLWRATVKIPSVAALCDIGWTLILWGGFFLARLLILGQDFPPQVLWLFMVGALLVLFFASPSKNIIKGVGHGVGALAGNFVNSFTDVVSYIRLFAVGLATVAMADSFNTMAKDVGFGNIFSSFVTVLILFIGHGLNILLGPMSVLVHGVRLNVLEFCSHADISWKGFAYRPFREK
ncbi:MAG: hypothetical protein NC938_06755 [Candidatus Omnitrophica bacterium]|nr:hypothetical protein [Candidatus Omnitrophota bacterium]MCM8791373.1 hypothetical protein [Candidatus Omnitrophota bacterium]